METLVVRYGEICLKGKNRKYFETQLVKNLRARLKHIDDCKVIRSYGRLFVEYDSSVKDDVITIAKNTFGIVSVSPSEQCSMTMESIKETAKEQIKNLIEKNGPFTYKVETKRSNKRFPIKSPAVSVEVGGFLDDEFEEITVELYNPDVTLFIEIRDNEAYIFSEKIPGAGGLPYGTSGSSMLLLSGGIDSPVAGWLMAKRGVHLEAIHFHSYPFTSERSQEKVLDLAKVIAGFCGTVVVHSVNLLEIQRAIQEHCPSSEMTIISRRFMMAIAERVALERKCQSLITGENIGQVASQTMEGLTVTNAKVDLPVFRPLIAMDKQDIINIAEKIESFEISIQPFEDCCTVFLPDRVVTKPKTSHIEESESKLAEEELITRAMENMERFYVRRGK